MVAIGKPQNYSTLYLHSSPHSSPSSLGNHLTSHTSRSYGGLWSSSYGGSILPSSSDVSDRFAIAVGTLSLAVANMAIRLSCGESGVILSAGTLASGVASCCSEGPSFSIRSDCMFSSCERMCQILLGKMHVKFQDVVLVILYYQLLKTETNTHYDIRMKSRQGIKYLHPLNE